jgi:hypothetical protein
MPVFKEALLRLVQLYHVKVDTVDGQVVKAVFQAHNLAVEARKVLVLLYQQTCTQLIFLAQLLAYQLITAAHRVVTALVLLLGIQCLVEAEVAQADGKTLLTYCNLLVQED